TFAIDFESSVDNAQGRDWLALGSGTITNAPVAMETFNGTYVFFVYPNTSPLGTPIDSGVPADAAGVHVTFTRTDAAYLAAITPYLPGASTTVLSLPYNGDVDSFSIGRIASFPNEPLYINNIQITPEPGCLSLVALGGAGVL